MAVEMALLAMMLLIGARLACSQVSLPWLLLHKPLWAFLLSIMLPREVTASGRPVQVPISVSWVPCSC